MGEKGHARRHPELKTPARTTIQRTRNLSIECVDVGHQGVGIPACANHETAMCERRRRRPVVRVHAQWCLLCCHEASTRQSGDSRWVLPQAATCPVCKHESIPPRAALDVVLKVARQHDNRMRHYEAAKGLRKNKHARTARQPMHNQQAMQCGTTFQTQG